MAKLLIGMSVADVLGWAACLMTLVTFAQQRMLLLRLAAISANLLFIGYGAFGHVLPVLSLHVVLLPLNVQHLYLQLRQPDFSLREIHRSSK